MNQGGNAAAQAVAQGLAQTNTNAAAQAIAQAAAQVRVQAYAVNHSLSTDASQQWFATSRSMYAMYSSFETASRGIIYMAVDGSHAADLCQTLMLCAVLKLL